MCAAIKEERRFRWFRTFGFVTAGIVCVFGLVLPIIYTEFGPGTFNESAGMAGDVLGIWFIPLLCLTINKLLGKSAGFWTILFTLWSWILFSYTILWSFAVGLFQG